MNQDVSRNFCFVPANDARVFFAAWNGQPLNPYGYSNFESLLRLLQKIQK